MKKTPKRRVVQGHHVTYQPEWKEPVFKGEHWILTQINRRKTFSIGFLLSLGYVIISNISKAVEAINEPV